ncbi:MAG: xanthine dehydrogenase family protein molybdopterin-binding subunit [Acidobacteria bacterium]|nr:xanthine dehydrogenase family protein molybdopterin-binding subunit [Acidobacteriota bacterium]
MANTYDWPSVEDRSIIGSRVSRLDGPDKSTGRAKYAYDRNPEGLLTGRLVVSPHANARIKKIDASGAEATKGVRGVVLIKDVGDEVQWVGDEIAAIAADTEELARDAVAKVKVEYEVLPHLVNDEDVKKAGNRVTPDQDDSAGDVAKALQDADVTHEGYYGVATITHCCLEPHGNTVLWEGEKDITVWASTQAVGRIGADLAKNLAADPSLPKISPSDVHVITPYMGGGFGSKFAIDSWGIAAAKLSRMTGRPVKIMLDRHEELKIAGGRPSWYGNVKVGAKKDGTLTAFESETWSTSGMGRGSKAQLPYVLTELKDTRIRHVTVATNTGPARAWRAPRHPQCAVITHCALTDLAAKLDMDPVAFFKKNADLTPRPDVYRAELDKAAELIDWAGKYHKPGAGSGHVRRGVGLSIHTWGGAPHDSQCRVTIEPDGAVTAELGSQDLGVGTWTVIAMVLAETVGLPLSQVKVNIGDSRYPPSGPSGGSTTVGGVSSSTRRAAVNAVEKLKEKVAADLGASSKDDIEAKGGQLRLKSNPKKAMTWAAACRKLGTETISEIGNQPDRDGGKLADQGVGGVQMADVSVDMETGIVTMNKMVAVQDCGLIIDLKTAESQVYGAMIMGICSALWEERVYDEISGAYLNADMEFYKLAGIGDIGELVVHMMTGVYDDRGVIGLGEPPAVSPMAAISNAVFNAIGVRVPTVPLTPDKVLAALEKKGGMA